VQGEGGPEEDGAGNIREQPQAGVGRRQGVRAQGEGARGGPGVGKEAGGGDQREDEGADGGEGEAEGGGRAGEEEERDQAGDGEGAVQPAGDPPQQAEQPVARPRPLLHLPAEVERRDKGNPRQAGGPGRHRPQVRRGHIVLLLGSGPLRRPRHRNRQEVHQGAGEGQRGQGDVHRHGQDAQLRAGAEQQAGPK